MALTLSEFDVYWPSWPTGVEGEVLAEVHLGCSVDYLVELLWARDSQFQVDVDDARGFVDYIATPWTHDVDELPSLPGGFDWNVDEKASSTNLSTLSQTSTQSVNYTDKMRKVRYNNQGGAAFLGQFFKNEELQRCREHIPSIRMVMEASVCTTAPYCDRIRVLCRYTLEAVTKKSSFLKINFCIAYVKNVNGMTKVFMEKGARGGLQRNFEIYVRTLEKFVPLLNGNEEEEEAISPSPPGTGPGVDDFMSTSRVSFINWRMVAVPKLSSYIERAIPHISKVGPGIPLSDHPLTRRSVAHVLAIIFFLLIAQIIMTLLGFVDTMLSTTTMKGGILQPFSYLVKTPDTLGELISAAFVLEIVHWTVNYLIDSVAIMGSQSDNTLGAQAETLRLSGHPAGSKINDESSGIVSPNSPLTETSRLSRESNLTSRQSTNQQLSGCTESASILKRQSVEPLLRSEASVDMTDEPSLIDNTVSFFKLGMVTAALGVELALSGITKTLQPANASLESSKDEDTVSIAGIECNSSTVLEDIFENERFQPFRGWGHAWPGHFLPTDRCGHWSTHNSAHEMLATSMVFSDVEPQLPRGWRWIDKDWQIDMAGQETEAVDKDGWQYGVDFSWIKFPSEAGKGKNSNLKLIRRRRWTRIRTRLDESIPPMKSTLSSLQMDEPDFLKPRLKEVMARFTAEPSSHKAMSERSYFIEGSSDVGSTAILRRSIANGLDIPAAKLHRRKSSGCLLERYYSMEGSCLSIQPHLAGVREQACQNEGSVEHPDQQANCHSDDDNSQTPGIQVNCGASKNASLSERKIRYLSDNYNLRTAWSDSEVGAEKWIDGNWLRGNSSNELHGKESAGGNQEVIPSLGNKNYHPEDVSCTSSETESYASYDPNWACMEGSKWIDECKSSSECEPKSIDLLY